jgi:uroporphyrin-3 C-methyltransferase
MTDDASNPSAPASRSFSWKRIGLVFLILILFIGLIMGSIFAYFAYIEWGNLQTTLSTQRQQYQTATAEFQKKIESLQQNVDHSQATLTKQAQVLKQIEGIEKGNVDMWRALSAAYLVRLANDQVIFTHDANVLPLLQRAIDVLQGANDSLLLKIQQTLRADVIRFQAIPLINTSALYKQLININNQLDELPIKSFGPVNSTTELDKPDTKAEHLPWWKAGWRHSLNLLKKIIIVHHQEGKPLPFILPQESTLFYQSLHAQLQNAIWGLLHHEPSIYDNSLTQLIAWIEKYIDTTKTNSQQVLSNLQSLKNQSIQPTTEDLAETIAEFEQYFALQNKPASTP